MPAALLLQTVKKWLQLSENSDKPFNRRAMKILIGPTEIFNLVEDALGEGELLVAELAIGLSDIVDFFGREFLLAIEEAPDATRGLRRAPSVAVDFCKATSCFRDFLFKLPRPSYELELVLYFQRSTHLSSP